jgi:hypothetical protein
MLSYQMQQGPGPKTETPWGVVQHIKELTDGVAFYSTASHGGFHVTPEVLATFPAYLRNRDGWYEEDCEWAKVALALPAFFDDKSIEAAKDTMKNWNPDIYETHFGVKLAAAESCFKRAEIAFSAANAENWVVNAAIITDDDPNMVECIASIGGRRPMWEGEIAEKAFLVPRDEYKTRPQFGFVIDLSRHQEFTGRSSFVTRR